MPTWDSQQYLRFERERTQPAVDLARRVELSAPQRLVDLGCGPGNSTAVLAERWPSARIEGVDTSEAMLAQAQRDYPRLLWSVGDIATWRAAQPYDLVFSNAALQWVPDHRVLLPQLFAQVAIGGALAFQVPANQDAPPHRLMRELAQGERWKTKFPRLPREWHVESPSFYYDVLASDATRVDLWTTEYLHVMPNSAAIVEWYRGTGLRPWLDALSDPADRDRFLADYGSHIAAAYPPQQDGRVLFPFKRLFVIAYR